MLPRGAFGGVKNVIPLNDAMVTGVIDFITFVKEIGGSGNARHLLDAWLIYTNLQYSGAVYRPFLINHEKVFPRNREKGVWHDRNKMMNDLIGVLDKYASESKEIEEALVAADTTLNSPSPIRQGKGRYGFETE